MASFCAIVNPMQHSIAGRLPMFLWNFPLPRNDDLVKLRDTGELRRAIDQMAARGFVPTVEMGWEWTPAGAMAMAKTLQEAALPVCVLIPRADFLEGTCYRDCKVWGDGPDASQGNKARKWPCLPLADTKAGATWLKEQLKPYADAGIKVSAVWFDDESLPHPWNGCFEAQKGSKDCSAAYAPDVLDNFESFKQYTCQLRARMFSEAAADPIHAMFPGALAGNYGDFASSQACPFVEPGGAIYPPRDIGRMDALMPSAYANTNLLPRYFKPEDIPTQEKVDRIYFPLLLRTVSTCNANKQPGKVSIPYLSRFCPDNPDPRLHFGMSRGLYRELLRHVWMRGTDSVYAFNLGFPGSGVSAELSLESLEDQRATLDELLAYREFVDRGKPMNFATPTSVDAPVVWSGLQLDNRCLVRAVALHSDPIEVRLTVFGNKVFGFSAPPTGVTWILRSNGSAEKIASGLM
jgi:hypothetical protein